MAFAQKNAKRKKGTKIENIFQKCQFQRHAQERN
jgi:hypothetical protein